MKRQPTLFFSMLFISLALACSDGSGSEPGFPVGSWQLTEVTFISDGATVSTSANRLNTFKLTFSADNSLTATGTGSDRNYTWSYEADTGIISITGGPNVSIEATLTEGEFSYRAYAITDMSNTRGEDRQIAEFAASSFIQNNVRYSTGASLEVYFKFSKI